MFDVSCKEIGIWIFDNLIIWVLVVEFGNFIVIMFLYDDEDEIMDYFVDFYVIYEWYDEQVEIIIDGGYGSFYLLIIIDVISGLVEIVCQGLGEFKE